MAIATPNNLPGPLQVIGFSKILRYLSLTEDIFTVLSENYNTKKKTVPNAIYMTVDGLESTSHTHRLPMVMPLSGAPTYGNVQSQVSREENIITKYNTIYKNDYSHAVVNQMFGIDAQDKRFYNIIEQEMPLLGTYFKELKGVHIRQALLERYSENLTTASPTNAVIASEWSPNFYIKNLLDSQQPVFSPNNTTYTNRIGTALTTAGTGVNTICDFNYLMALEHYASYSKRIQPLMIGGKQKYVVLIPANQARFLKDPSLVGSFGSIWTQYNRMNNEAMNWPNILGEMGSLILIEDPRAPTLTIGGTSAPFTLTAGYLYPGNSDRRDTSVEARDVGFLIGKGALVDWTAESVHYETEDALTYGKFRGKGGFGTNGCQQAQYDVVNNNAREQFTSIALVFGRQTSVS